MLYQSFYLLPNAELSSSKTRVSSDLGSNCFRRLKTRFVFLTVLFPEDVSSILLPELSG